MKPNDSYFRNWQETETETERTVSYDSARGNHITVHIPKHTPEEQAEYEKNVRAALRRFYYHVTVERGYDWDELVGKNTGKKETGGMCSENVREQQ